MKFKLNILNDGFSYFLFEDVVTFRIPKDHSNTIVNLTNCKPDDWISIDCSKPYGHFVIGGKDCSHIHNLIYYINPPLSEIENQNLRWFGCFFDKYFEITRKKMNLKEYIELNEIAAKSIKYEDPWYTQNQGMKTTFIHIQGTNSIIDTKKNKNGYTDFKVEFWLTQQNVVQPPVYTFKFYYDDGTNYVVSATSSHGVDGTTLFPVIENILQKFVDDVDDLSIIHFIADKNEKSRIRLYDFLLNKISKKGYYVFDDETLFPQDGKDKHYAFTKSKDCYENIMDGTWVYKKKQIP